MDETHDHGTEIYIQDGILLLSAPSNHTTDVNASGSLSIVKYSDNIVCVEWRPNYLIMVESDAQDWAVVDTIGRRTRTLSGSNGDTQSSSRVIQILLEEIKSYSIERKGKHLTLKKKAGGEKSTFVFPNSNADSFVYQILAHCKTLRASYHNTVPVRRHLDNDAFHKSLTELELFQDDPSDSLHWSTMGNIVNNLRQRPYETTLEAFAKLSSIVYPDYSPEDTPSMLQPKTTSDDSSTTHNSDGYEVVNQSPALPPRPSILRGAPFNAEHWKGIQDPEGRITQSDDVKHMIFKGGIDPSIRSEVWKYLLNYYPWDMTNVERIVLQKQKAKEYFTIKQQWKSFSPAQEERFSEYHEKKNLIGKDVNRTDRVHPFYAGDNNPNLTTLNDILMTFMMYNFDLGYVQGMSDLLSPILYILRDEVDAFWCFVGFMDKVEKNFEMDQAGMKSQLESLNLLLTFTNPDLAQYLSQHDSKNMYFCFRWLLVLFKREFSQDDIMNLWEVIWTGLPCSNFHLLVSVAILDTEKDVLMTNGYSFTEILKHVNDLSMNINLQFILSKAEAIYYQVTSSSHLTDTIRIILGLEPVGLAEDGAITSSPLTNIHDTDTNEAAKEAPLEASSNGISLQTDKDEVSYQRSIDFHYL